MGLFGDSSKVERLQEDNTALREKLDRFIEKYTELDNLQRILDETRAQVTEYINKEKELRESYNAQKVELSTKIWQMEERVRKLELDKQSLEDSVDRLKMNHQEMQLEKSEESDVIQQLRNEIDILKSTPTPQPSVDLYSSERETFEFEIEQLKAERDALALRLISMDQEMNALRTAATDAAASAAAATESLRQLEQEQVIPEPLPIAMPPSENYIRKEDDTAREKYEEISIKIEERDQKFQLILQNIEEAEIKYMSIKESLRKLDDVLLSKEDTKLQLENVITGLAAQIKEKEDLLNEYTEKRERFLKDIYARQKELAVIDQDIILKKASLQEIHSKYDEQEALKNRAVSEIKSFEFTRDELQRELLQKREQEEVFYKNIADLQSQTEILEKRKIELEKSATGIEGRLSETLQKFNEELQSTKDQYYRVKLDVFAKEKQLSEIEKQIAEKSTLFTEQETMIKVHQKRIGNTEQQLKKLNEQKQSLLDDLQRLTEREGQKKQLYYELKIDADNLQTKKTDFEREVLGVVESMQKQYTSLDLQRKQLLDELSVAEEKSHVLDKSISEMQEMLSVLQNQVQGLEIQKVSLEGRVTQLTTLETSLQKRVSFLQSTQPPISEPKEL